MHWWLRLRLRLWLVPPPPCPAVSWFAASLRTIGSSHRQTRGGGGERLLRIASAVRTVAGELVAAAAAAMSVAAGLGKRTPTLRPWVLVVVLLLLLQYYYYALLKLICTRIFLITGKLVDFHRVLSVLESFWLNRIFLDRES